MQLNNTLKIKGNGQNNPVFPNTRVRALEKSRGIINRKTYWLEGLLFFCLAWTWSAVFAETAATPQAIDNNEIKQIIAAKQHPLLTQPNFENRSEDLDALYQLSHYQLLWLGNDKTEKNIDDLLSVMDNAAGHGLDPSAYEVSLLREKLPGALHENQTKLLAQYDTALSLSLLRFLHDLHYGRVNPQGIDFNLKLREKKLVDLPFLIKDGIAQGTIAQLPDTVEPKLRQYQQLKSALATYRELAKKVTPLHLSLAQSLRPGNAFNQAEELRQFLSQTGDLPEFSDTATTPPGHYSEPLVDAVKKFQLRHGLAADGVLGKSTLAELNTPLSLRVGQIELAMERLRWLPELSNDPSVIVNIPAFQLWAYDNINALQPEVTTMKVVVGQALKNQTPVLMAEMRYIDFMPYWNVPYNIVKKEILPKLLVNPGYLAKENMEIVSGSTVVGFSEETLNLLKQGKARIRQRPGKKNSLGRVKFLFPNKDDVYLHDTPSNTLFNRSRRDFSHGCVRLEKPQKLAEFALKNQEGWDSDSIKAAMSSNKSKRVILNQAIPVLFFYTTAFFDQDNNLIFYPDIYGHDTTLREALKTQEDISDHSLFARPSAPSVISQAEAPKTTDESAK